MGDSGNNVSSSIRGVCFGVEVLVGRGWMFMSIFAVTECDNETNKFAKRE